MPALIALYENYADHRDKFAVFAIHDKSVKSFAELDKHLPRIREQCWQGKDLPFPVLLDATGQTEKLYGIEGHPTGLLIDPEGRLVGMATAAELEAKLPPLPAGQKWAGRRDIQTNVSWAFESTRDTLATFAHILSLQSGCVVELDTDAIRAAGLTPEGPLPGALFGGPATLRSIEALFLSPHGLGIVPSADGKKLIISKRANAKEAESYFQKLRGSELSKRLERGPTTAEATTGHRLEIKDHSLLAAAQLISREYDLPVALDAKAMRAKLLDPNAKVTGTIGAGDLRESLSKMLDPFGLTVEVRDEVVFVTPKGK